MEAFQKGDVVELKSGGPKMTVIDINGDTVQCTYFDKDGNPKSGFFSTVALQKA